MTLKLVIEITDRYEGGPIRQHDPDAKMLHKTGSLSGWIETPHPERWGITETGGVMATPPDLHGVRVFPAATLDAARQQLSDWAWLDQARLDA